MTASDANVFVNCSGCGRDNEPNMAFCLYCGQAMAAPQQPLAERRNTASGTMCPRCGKFDELTSRFCVHCGADTSTAVRPSDPSFMSWELPNPAAADAVVAAPRASLLRTRKDAAKQPPLIVTMVGVLLGAAIGCGFAVMAAPVMQKVSAPRYPNQSLNIFARQPFAQVTVIPYPSETAANFTVGQLSKDGELTLKGLAPGRYLVRIEADNYRRQLFGVIDPITIDENKTTLLGEPTKPIDLPPRHTQKDAS